MAKTLRNPKLTAYDYRLMTKMLSIFPDHIQEGKLAEAAEVLEKGGIVIYPTDTIYAMGCSIMQPNSKHGTTGIDVTQRWSLSCDGRRYSGDI